MPPSSSSDGQVRSSPKLATRWCMRSLDHLEGIGAHNAERARLDTPPQNGTSACARDQKPIRPNSRPDPKHHIAELGRKPGTDAFFDLKTHPDGAMYHDLKIVRFDGGLFFANAGAVEDHLR